MTRIYISGKVTNNPTAFMDFEDAERELLDKNYEVVNPQKALSSLPESFTHKDYMDLCLLMLDKCDAIYMLDNWEKSMGACIEYGYAKAQDKIVLFEGKEYA